MSPSWPHNWACETVGVVLGVRDRLRESVERVFVAADVVDAPEVVGGDVTRARSDRRLGVTGEDIRDRVGVGGIFESEDEFAHTGTEAAQREKQSWNFARCRF